MKPSAARMRASPPSPRHRSPPTDAPAERRNFVTCPIVRDTASVPCWLAEHDGELYFLTLQTDVSAPVTPPWLGHRVLVEGAIAAARPRICGGIVLEPVVLSVLPELDASCNTAVLPAEDRYNLTFEPPRPPGPSAGRLAFAGAPQPPAPTEPPREFTLRYDFDGLVVFRHAADLTAIFDAARTRNARRITITGHRGSVLLSNGTTLTEQAGLGTPPRGAAGEPAARRRPNRHRIQNRLARRARHPRRRERSRAAPRHGRAHPLKPRVSCRVLQTGARGASAAMDGGSEPTGMYSRRPRGRPFGASAGPQEERQRAVAANAMNRTPASGSAAALASSARVASEVGAVSTAERTSVARSSGS